MIISLKKRLQAYMHGRRRVVFLHTQKTAGTTLVTLARAKYGLDLISHGDYLDRSRKEIQDISFVSGHFGFEYAQQMMRNRYSFTFLRNPVERIISFYYFCRSRDPNKYPIYALAHKVDLAGFLKAGIEDPLIHLYIWNQQTWQLACGSANLHNRSIDDLPEEELLKRAIDNLDQFSHVGFTETFEQDLVPVCAALSLPVPTERIVENHTARPGRELLSPAELDLAKRLTSLDDELYRVAWARRRPQERMPTI